MKPDWKDAPEWAQWLAMDEDGMWGWYEIEPRISSTNDFWFSPKGKSSFVKISEWKKTLEQRQKIGEKND